MLNRQFAALRGIAIILVVLNHSIHLGIWFRQEWGLPKMVGWVYYALLVLEQLGIFAVPIFLFISGCFFAYAAKGKNLYSTYRFVWTNLGHIIFPYIIWSFVFYLIIYIWLGEAYIVSEYVKHLLVGYPFNFVPLLIFFYILGPILVYLTKKFGWLVIGLLALYQILLINLIYPGILGFQFPSQFSILETPVIRMTMSTWGIYFPLGLVYSLKAKSLLPILERIRWLLLIATILLFFANIVRWASSEYPPLEGFFAPLTMILLLPLIPRERIPLARILESVGKRSYGLYLMHFNFINLTLFVIQVFMPILLGVWYILLPLLFVVGIGIPMVMMNGFARYSRLGSYRYVFG